MAIGLVIGCSSRKDSGQVREQATEDADTSAATSEAVEDQAFTAGEVDAAAGAQAIHGDARDAGEAASRFLRDLFRNSAFVEKMRHICTTLGYLAAARMSPQRAREIGDGIHAYWCSDVLPIFHQALTAGDANLQSVGQFLLRYAQSDYPARERIAGEMRSGLDRDARVIVSTHFVMQSLYFLHGEVSSGGGAPSAPVPEDRLRALASSFANERFAGSEFPAASGRSFVYAPIGPDDWRVTDRRNRRVYLRAGGDSGQVVALSLRLDGTDLRREFAFCTEPTARVVRERRQTDFGWGEEVDGLQLGLRADRTECAAGEGVKLTLGLRAAPRCSGWRVTDRPDSLTLVIKGPGGRDERELDRWGPAFPPPLRDWVVLRPEDEGASPGQDHVLDRAGAGPGSEVTFPEPGTYRLQATYSLDGRRANARRHWSPAAWKGGSVSSNVVTVEVAARSAAPAPDAPAAEAPRGADMAWGEAVNGLRAGIAVLGPVYGRPGRMRFRLYQRNVGEAPLRVLEMLSRKRYPHGLYEVTVDGRAVKCQMPWASQPDPPPSAYSSLAPGEEDRASEMLVLADGWDMRPPCTAEISLVVRNERPEIVAHDAEGRAVSVSGLWTGAARSGAVAGDVTPPPSAP